MSAALGLLAVLVLTAGTGYFVAQEFAYVAADRLALAREAAAGDTRATRALKVLERLSFMLSGAQLGITVCTLGLGSVSKPAISHELDPLLHQAGLPNGLSYGVSFALAMFVVVFLHMVVGEMAPKSWAIAHPERSAMLLTPPFRAMIRAVRPLIVGLDKVSNALVRLCRVTPRDALASVHNREQLTHLVEESERLGLISKEDSELITSSLTAPQHPVGDLQVPADRITSVPADAGIDAVLSVAGASDRTRLLVRDGATVVGSVHARDALVARAQGRAALARELARPVPELAPHDTVAHAVEQLRLRRASLAVVRDDSGRLTGLVSLDDLLGRLMEPRAV